MPILFYYSEKGTSYTYFLKPPGGESDESLGESLSEDTREDKDAGHDPPCVDLTGPDFDFETKGAQGHQEVKKINTILVN